MTMQEVSWTPKICDKEWLDRKAWLTNTHYNKLRGIFEEMNNMYNQEYSLGKLRKGVVPFKPARFRRQIDTAVDHVMQLSHIVDMMPWNKNELDRDKISTFRQFGEGLVGYLDSNYVFSPRRMCLKNGFLFGIFILKMEYSARMRPDGMVSKEDFDSWDDYLEYSFPFSFRSVHPKNILADPADPPMYVIETSGRTVASIKKDFPFWTNEPGYSDTTNVTFDECWTAEQKQFFVNGKSILDDQYDDIAGVYSKQNLLGVLPYELGYTGFGIQSADGKPEESIVGMAAPIVSAVTQHARLMTAINHGVQSNAYGSLMVEKQPERGKFKLPQFVGDIAVIHKDYQPKPLPSLEINKDVYGVMRFFDEESQIIMANPMMGAQGEGIYSGYQEAQRSAHSKTKLDCARESWGYVISNMTNKVLFVVKHLVDEPVGIIGNVGKEKAIVTIKPRDIHPEYQKFIITLDIVTPEDKDRRMHTGALLVGKRVLSNRAICRDFMGYDPDEQQEEILLEEAFATPEIRSIITRSIMANRQIDEQLARIEGTEAMTGGGNLAAMMGQGQVAGMPQGQPSVSARTIKDNEWAQQRGSAMTHELFSAPEQTGVRTDV